MEPFVAVPGGWESLLEDWERELVAGLVGQVSAVLSDAAGQEEESAGPGQAAPGWEALMLRERLLPEPSEDPAVAVEVGARLRGQVRDLKRLRLHELFVEMGAPHGRGGAVRVDAGSEVDWLGCLTDLRQALAWRLGIEDAQDAQAVHALALGAVGPDAGQEDAGQPLSDRQVWAVTYEMLTWWQESLLAVLVGEDLPPRLEE